MSLPAHWSAGMGGSEYQAKLLLEHLLAHYDVEITYLTAVAAADYRPRGYALVRCGAPGPVRRYGTFFDALSLYRALQRLAPDIVYQQVGCAHTGIAAHYARVAGCRLVWRVSSDRQVGKPPFAWWRVHHRLEQRFLEYGIRRADIVLAQTQRQQASIEALYGCRNVVVVPNFHPPVDVDGGERLRDRKRVAWIANIKRLKNPLAFVRLAARFANEQPDVDFVAAGAIQEPRVGAEFLTAISGLPNFRYVGRRTQVECEELLASATLLVNTSDFEGLPNTFVQAWLHRVPVVSLRVDPDEALSRGGLGRVAYTEERLHGVVRQLLADDACAARIGERCRAYALERHSMANADQLAALLQLRPRTPAAAPSAAEGPLLVAGG